MKKFMGFMLSMTLLVSAAVPSYAAGFTPPGLAKKGGLPPGIAKKFKDLDGFEWAKEAIERLAEKGILSGVGEGVFAPSSKVTKIEALAMIIRGLDWDDDVKLSEELIKAGEIQKKAKDKAKDKDKLQTWTEGYIEVAVEKGLINEVDLAQQNFTEPATRQEVAMYIIRALGMEEEAEDEDYSLEDLEFKDEAAIQVGAVGYVYLITEEGIMKGYPDNTFRPNQPVKRAEMASLVATLNDRLDDIDDDDDDVVVIEEIFKGNIKSIDRDDREIVVKNSSREKLFKIENRTVIKIDGKTEEFKDLNIDMKVELNIVDDKVHSIYAQSRTETLRGTIKEIYTSTEKLKIRVGSTDRTITLDSDTDIEVDGRNVDFDDLAMNMEVDIRIENGKVIEVYAESVTREYRGILIEKIIGTQNKLTIKIDNQNKTYVIDGDADIREEDGDELDFDDLEVGSKLEIRLENNIIVKIEMED